jgi:organic hydroperoxide reductase OsmC/OhrA
MSTHNATITWTRRGAGFDYETYNREHEWSFGSGQRLNASAAPAYKGSEECVDPEEAFAASIASCHMLTFLAIASKKRFVVESYSDGAVAHLEKNEEGALAVTRVELHPKISFSGDKVPSDDEIGRMHESAHRNCFIANSVKTEVVVVSP